MQPEHLIEAFPDLDEMTEDCPRGCTHGTDEPECGLDEAVERGEADPVRVESFRRLLAARSLNRPTDIRVALSSSACLAVDDGASPDDRREEARDGEAACPPVPRTSKAVTLHGSPTPVTANSRPANSRLHLHLGRG